MANLEPVSEVSVLTFKQAREHRRQVRRRGCCVVDFHASMADIWSLSSPDSCDDSGAVEDLISQAIDLSALEQIAALNTSLVSDSVLPTDLETRFRKLKSFPGADHPNQRDKRIPKSPKRLGQQKPGEETPLFSDESMKPELLSQTQRAVSKSSNGSRNNPGSSPESDIEDYLSERPNAVKDHDPKSSPGSFSSPSILSDSAVAAASCSPPQRICCSWCSPKRTPRKRGEERRDVGDLSTLSLKDHQRKIEKMLKKQEEMISREADKVLKWAKQASAK